MRATQVKIREPLKKYRHPPLHAGDPIPYGRWKMGRPDKPGYDDLSCKKGKEVTWVARIRGP
jgi:hypothetical protein